MVLRRSRREPGRGSAALFPNCALGQGRCRPLFIVSAAALSETAGPQIFGQWVAVTTITGEAARA